MGSSFLLWFTNEFWFLSLTEKLNSHEHLRFVNKNLQGKAYLRFYRCQQIVSRLTFQCSGTILVTQHHLAILIGQVVGSYAILTESTDADIYFIKGFIMMLIPLGHLTTLGETLFMSRIVTAVDTFLHQCKVHFGTNSQLKRGFRSCQPIRFWTGYPFFCITSKKFFILFFKLIVDQTINLKLSLR